MYVQCVTILLHSNSRVLGCNYCNYVHAWQYNETPEYDRDKLDAAVKRALLHAKVCDVYTYVSPMLNYVWMWGT